MPQSDQGLSTPRYSLIPRTLIFLTREQAVLLIKGAPQKRLWANRYNGIGGHVERGEDVLSAARRELLEETGLEVPGLRLCGTVTIDAGETLGVALFVFTADCSGLPPHRLEQLSASQEGQLAWIPVERLPDLPLVEDLPELLPRVLAHTASQAPFAAHYFYREQQELVIRFADASA